MEYPLTRSVSLGAGSLVLLLGGQILLLGSITAAELSGNH